MIDIALNISVLKQRIPLSVRIVAVSKTKPVSDILIAYNTGHRIFGENRVQELLSKNEKLPSDIEWHLIGHLQSNKVRFLVPFINMIEKITIYDKAFKNSLDGVLWRIEAKVIIPNIKILALPLFELTEIINIARVQND